MYIPDGYSCGFRFACATIGRVAASARGGTAGPAVARCSRSGEWSGPQPRTYTAAPEGEAPRFSAAHVRVATWGGADFADVGGDEPGSHGRLVGFAFWVELTYHGSRRQLSHADIVTPFSASTNFRSGIDHGNNIMAQICRFEECR